MRTAPKSDQEKLEIEVAERTDRRKGGFELGNIRDTGYRQLSNGVTMLWHVDRELNDGEVRKLIPDNSFVLVVDGKEILFDGEEFKHWLRWV